MSVARASSGGRSIGAMALPPPNFASAHANTVNRGAKSGWRGGVKPGRSDLVALGRRVCWLARLDLAGLRVDFFVLREGVLLGLAERAPTDGTLGEPVAVVALFYSV